MSSVPPALTFLLTIFAGWVNRHQVIVIEYLQAENLMLQERLRRRRLRFSDAERALLAHRAKALVRRALLELRTIVTLDTLRLPPRSPNLNPFAERFVRSIKGECLSRMIFVGQGALRRAVREYVAHYRGEGNHRSL